MQCLSDPLEGIKKLAEIKLKAGRRKQFSYCVSEIWKSLPKQSVKAEMTCNQRKAAGVQAIAIH